MNEVPDEWDELENDNRVFIRVETEEYDALMHPDIDEMKAFFPDNGEQELPSKLRLMAPFKFQMAFHKEVVSTPVDEQAEEAAEKLAEQFEETMMEVYDQFDGIADVLEMNADDDGGVEL